MMPDTNRLNFAKQRKGLFVHIPISLFCITVVCVFYGDFLQGIALHCKE